ncbi:acyl-ACP thioesterase domain-containing protein [Marispirochaeta sp.]|jgi:medium-chain acyl-[acyl-carrier-protein] hydrolase|uniref:acyl-[acyl-carrier-protein] thioesterase n=1 Tax=Marispirochaeta sp. TaxID=2038653 RepID=UPI0029C81F45|nr:acyl-ACP thioesterase domain-containing protein [Marispirochaeta sp.]
MIKITRYSFSHTVIYSEIDARGQLALPSFSAIFQEAALLQAEVLGFGESYCADEGRMWVLSRLRVEFDRLPVHREEIRVETWPKEPQGPLARRDYRIFGANGDLCARATSGWMLLDTASMRPIRPQQVFQDFDFSGVDEAVEGSAPKVPGCEGKESSVVVTARYSDLDQNDHVNNTRYVRWVLDCFTPEEFDGHEMTGFDINYTRAAGWNDTVTLKRCDKPCVTTVRGYLEDGNESFAAMLRYRES